MIINDRIRKLKIHQFYGRVQVPSSTLKRYCNRIKRATTALGATRGVFCKAFAGSPSMSWVSITPGCVSQMPKWHLLGLTYTEAGGLSYSSPSFSLSSSSEQSCFHKDPMSVVRESSSYGSQGCKTWANSIGHVFCDPPIERVWNFVIPLKTMKRGRGILSGLFTQYTDFGGPQP